MEAPWIFLLILAPINVYAESVKVESLSSERWYQAEAKNGFQDIKVYKNSDGTKILKLNPLSLSAKTEGYRLELLLLGAVPKFYSFGEVADLSEFAAPMPKEFCLNCHLSSKDNLLFTDRYLQKWSLKEDYFQFERINRKLKLVRSR